LLSRLLFYRNNDGSLDIEKKFASILKVLDGAGDEIIRAINTTLQNIERTQENTIDPDKRIKINTVLRKIDYLRKSYEGYSRAYWNNEISDSTFNRLTEETKEQLSIFKNEMNKIR
jgi:hypothetical protein